MTQLEILSQSCIVLKLPLERKRGVYILIQSDEVVYVGSSADIDARLYDHIKGNPKKTFDRAIWIPIPEGDLEAYEGAITRAFAPRYNSYTKRDSSRDVEILSMFGLQYRGDDAYLSSMRASRAERKSKVKAIAAERERIAKKRTFYRTKTGVLVYAVGPNPTSGNLYVFRASNDQAIGFRKLDRLTPAAQESA